jgi:colanic acid biosynthesis glycosyl transferase WcaI
MTKLFSSSGDNTDIAVVDFSNHHFIKSAVTSIPEGAFRASYIYSADFQSPNMRNASENYTDKVVPVSLDRPFEKYTLVRRRQQEKAWANRCCKVLHEMQPDAVLAANCPVDVLEALHHWARANDVKFGVWVQDLYGPLMERLLSRKLFLAGTLVGKYYTRREHAVLRDSDVLVSIDGSLQDYITTAVGRDSDVLANWACLDDLEQHPHDNQWASDNGFSDTQNVVYTGTLGMKHSPNLLADLAYDLRTEADARVIVVSEGLGADYLASEKASRQLDNLVLLPFQSPQVLGQILGSAHVCTLLLNESASEFCIPSKVLGYMCAGRPVAAAMPDTNPAAALINQLEVGSVSKPTDFPAFSRSVRRLLDLSYTERKLMGKTARTYAEREFNPDLVHARLSRVFQQFVELDGD